MSKEKPFSKHKFRPGAMTPKSCTTCGQGEEHDNHQGRKYPKRGMARVVQRQDWKVFNAKPESTLPRTSSLGAVFGRDPVDPRAAGSGQREDDANSPARGPRTQGQANGQVPSHPESGSEVPSPFPVAEIDKSQMEEFTCTAQMPDEQYEEEPDEPEPFQ